MSFRLEKALSAAPKVLVSVPSWGLVSFRQSEFYWVTPRVPSVTPLPGIDVSQTIRKRATPTAKTTGFSPLPGIDVSQTPWIEPLVFSQRQGPVPFRGLMSFRRCQEMTDQFSQEYMFQSPSGDRCLSDMPPMPSPRPTSRRCFSPLAGIDVFQTRPEGSAASPPKSFSPLPGIDVFQTQLRRWRKRDRAGFSPLTGIDVFQTLRANLR